MRHETMEDSPWAAYDDELQSVPVGLFCEECLHLRLAFPIIESDQEFLDTMVGSKIFRDLVEGARNRVREYMAQRAAQQPAELDAIKRFFEQVVSIYSIYTEKEFLLQFKENPSPKHPTIEVQNEEGVMEKVYINRARRELHLVASQGYDMRHNMMPVQLTDSQPGQLYEQMRALHLKSRDKTLRSSRRHRLPRDEDCREKAEASQQSKAAVMQRHATAESSSRISEVEASLGLRAPKTPAPPMSVNLQPRAWNTMERSGKKSPAKFQDLVSQAGASVKKREPVSSQQRDVTKARKTIQSGQASQGGIPVVIPQGLAKKRAHSNGTADKDARVKRGTDPAALIVRQGEETLLAMHEASAKVTAETKVETEEISEEQPFDNAALMRGQGDKRKPNGVPN